MDGSLKKKAGEGMEEGKGKRTKEGNAGTKEGRKEGTIDKIVNG